MAAVTEPALTFQIKGLHLPKKRQKEEIPCRYFRWLLGRRNAVYSADGRSNAVNLGRHSLGTRDRIEALRQLAHDYAYRTIYVALTTLKQAIGPLVKAGHLPASCRFDLPLKKADGTETYCWTATEVRAILDHCRSVPELAWLVDALLALALTGLRISELAGLRWGDVDLTGGMIRLTDETAWAGANTLTARTITSGRGRVFPIHDELRAVLETLPRQADGRVFHGPLGGKLKPATVRRRLVSAVLEPLAERFSTPDGERGFAAGRLNSFRHFFCSLCANEGLPQQTVMSWLGHRDSAMVRHYYHLHDDDARRHMRRLTLGGETAGPVKRAD